MSTSLTYRLKPDQIPTTVAPAFKSSDEDSELTWEDNTDFSLKPDSIEIPPMKLISDQKTRAWGEELDADTQKLFHNRLRLFCLIGSLPLLFYFVSGTTQFIEIFGAAAIGVVGLGLCGSVLFLLLSTAATMFYYGPFAGKWLRVLEVAIFGLMTLFFAYWQFEVLTGQPMTNFEGSRHERAYVLAVALVVHFNWFALMVFHGVLVPNTLLRGVAITVAMCVVPLAIDAIVVAIYSTMKSNAGLLFAVSVTLLAAGAILAIFGTAKTVELQREVQSAREAVRQLGQYRLRRKLGSGGMGEVYLAEHHLLKRPCALKRIHAKYLGNTEQLKRFQLEVQATAQLRHPNTVEIYDYGVSEDGTFFYVMEYLPGLSLEDLVGRYGPLPPERVIHLLRQVCGALREAHKHGLIHRDIKPSNILVFPDGSPHDQIKLVDFGLVHSLFAEMDQEKKITREGLIVGTPEYMSPEQASGSPLDFRSDLFSLGSVAYYLLTGREAFHKENSMKTLIAVATEEPKPIDELNPHIPEDLRFIVQRCLEKDVKARFHTAAELDAALQQCHAYGQWTEDRANTWWQAHPESQSGTGTDLNSLPI